VTAGKNKLVLTGSRQFTSWLSEHQVSLCFSTYQAGKLFFVGMSENQKLSVFERTFSRCMGIGLDPRTQALWAASLYQIWCFENALKKGQKHQGYDRVYVPQVGFTTGDIVHEPRIEGVVEELYDVCTLPGAERPMAIGFMKEEIRHTLSLP